MTGDPLKSLQQQMQQSPAQDPPEYDWSAPNASALHLARLQELGASLYGAMGIERADRAARDDFANANVLSFGAPAVLLCYFPRLMGPPQWSDVGMWL